MLVRRGQIHTASERGQRRQKAAKRALESLLGWVMPIGQRRAIRTASFPPVSNHIRAQASTGFSGILAAKSVPTRAGSCLHARYTWAARRFDAQVRQSQSAGPYVKRHHRLYDFVLELTRLVEVSRDGVAQVLDKIIETHPEPFYDHEDRLKTLIERLFMLGDRPRALAFCDRLRNVKGMPELFRELRARA